MAPGQAVTTTGPVMTTGDPAGGGPDRGDPSGERTPHEHPTAGHSPHNHPTGRRTPHEHPTAGRSPHDDPAGDGFDRPGIFVRYRDGRPQYGPGCAVLAIVASVAVIVIFLLIIHAMAPLLGGVTPR